MTTTINTENVRTMASVYYLVDQINQIKNAQDLYDLCKERYFDINLPIAEVYERLQGWKKSLYKDFLMAGCIYECNRQFEFSFGNYRFPKESIIVSIKEGEDFDDTRMTWNELLKLDFSNLEEVKKY